MATNSPRKHRNINYEIFILGLSLLSLVNLLIEILPIDPAVKNLTDIIDVALTPIFLVDFLYRLIKASSKWGYLIKEGGWLDFIGSLPFPGLRLARLFRMWRVYKELRRIGMRNVWQAYQKSRAESALLTIVLLTVLVLEFSGIFILVTERHDANANIKTASDALWWAYVTVTTVGYGDKYPVSNAGRIVGVLLMSIGVGLFGVLTGYLANVFLRPYKEEQSEKNNDSITANEPQILLEEMKRMLIEQELGTAELKKRIEALERLMLEKVE